MRLIFTAFSKLPLWTQYDILSSGRLLYLSDEERLCNTKEYVIRDYLDFKYYFDEYHRYFKESLLKGTFFNDSSMTLDNNRVEKLLILLKDNLSKLNNLSTLSSDEFINDYRNNQSALRLLQVLIESIIDIGNHIISRKNLELPQTYSDVFRILEKSSIISEKCRDKCSGMVKFRNRIVHLYHDIDIIMVFKYIRNDLDDFKQFMQEISGLLGE